MHASMTVMFLHHEQLDLYADMRMAEEETKPVSYSCKAKIYPHLTLSIHTYNP